MNRDLGSDTLMSTRCAKNLGLFSEVSTDFTDPDMQDLTGNITRFIGILRDVPFRLKGTSVTIRRDFLVTDAIDDLADIFLGNQFIEQYLGLVIGPNVLMTHLDRFWSGVKKSTIAVWHPKKKESPDEVRRREQEEEQREAKAQEQEIKRQQREREKLRQLDEERRRHGHSHVSSS
jgi:hypothetical protein